MKRIKKLLCVMLFIIISFILIPDVEAASASIKVSSNKSKVIIGGTFTTTVTISSGTPIAAWEYDISYDSSKLTLVSGSNHVLEYTQNTNKYSATYTYTFKAKAKGDSNISVKNYLVSDWNETSMGISISSSSVTVITQEEYEESLSKDCNLKSLSVEGATLSKEFSPDTLEYTVELEPLVTKINILATKNDSKSSVTGTGEKEVTEGENNFDIVVTAENGSAKTYKLKVIVKELSPIKVKIDKNEYTVVRKRENLIAPENYTEKEVKIGEEEVPGYYSDITKLTLVGLKDKDNKISLYIFNDKKNSYTKYNEITFSKIILYQMELDKDDIPFNFKKTKIKISEEEYIVYKNDESSKYCLIYGMNTESGKKNIYMYEETEGTIQKFDVDSYNKLMNDNNYYKNLLYCSCGVLVFLLIMMIVMTIKLSKSNKSIKKLKSLEEMIDNKRKNQSKSFLNL